MKYKRLIVCFDGTWNNPKQEENGVIAPTNVVKIKNAIADSDGDIEQRVFYHRGLGGEEMGKVEKVKGGAIGYGISRHIKSAYHWLAENYNHEDEDGKPDLIYFFGFSRGAFTVRSICGMIAKCGLINLSKSQDPDEPKIEPDEGWTRATDALTEYRRGEVRNPQWAPKEWNFHNNRNPIDIHFLGVWDTVGALGIPDHLKKLNKKFEEPKNWRFHDTELSTHVKTARHAMAIDEYRYSFTVCRWTKPQDHPNAEELWFPGCHSDVGGGYSDSSLSDGALSWMIEEAEKKDLKFRPEAKTQIKPEALGPLHISFKGMIFGNLESRPRNIPSIDDPANNPLFHRSAHKRHQNSPISFDRYWPTIQLISSGNSHTCDVFSDERWNYTRIYLLSGKYTFKAKGEWLDSKDACDWKGTENNGKPTIGDRIRAIFKKKKRAQDLPWFCLTGAIANDGLGKPGDKIVRHDGSPHTHQYLDLSKHETTPFPVEKPGY